MSFALEKKHQAAGAGLRQEGAAITRKARVLQISQGPHYAGWGLVSWAGQSCAGRSDLNAVYDRPSATVGPVLWRMRGLARLAAPATLSRRA